MKLDAQTWQEIERIFSGALEIDPDGRSDYLDRECGDSSAFREAVDAMLAADGREGMRVERLLNSTSTGESETRESAAATELAGKRFGPFRVERLIGQGGMGEVYLAERADDLYHQRVAIKLVRPGSRPQELAERFRLERQILARLEHPNIATLLDGGIEDGVPYLVMQYVDGTPLLEYCDRERLSIEERLGLFVTVCETVGFAHSRLVVHRDLKPSNILVTAAGEIKLLDFGIAKMLEADEAASELLATRTESRILTPEYAAPEQIRGGDISTATDVYGLGVLLYRLLTGRSPYDSPSGDPVEFERAVCEIEPRRPAATVTRISGRLSPRSEETLRKPTATPDEIASARNTVPKRLQKRIQGDLETIVLKSLSKAPVQRYRSADRLAEEIRRFLSGEPIAAVPPHRLYRARKFIARHPLGMLTGAVFALMLLGFSFSSWQQSRRVAGERDRAQLQEQRATRVVELLVDLFEASDPTVNPGGDSMPVSEFLELGEARVHEMEDQPEIQSRLWHVLGRIQSARSKLPASQRLLERALAGRRALDGELDDEMLHLVRDLGLAVGRRGDRERARSLHREALEFSRTLYGESHPLVARSLQDVGVSLGGAEGIELVEQALAMRRELLAADDIDLADNLNSLGLARRAEGRTAEAKALLTEALEILLVIHGEDHPHSAAVMGNIAAVTENLSEREAINRRRLAIVERIYDPMSWSVAIAKNNLATTLGYLGDHAESESIFREVVTIWLAVVGPEHNELANATRNLAVVVDRQRRHAEARTLFLEAIDIGLKSGQKPVHQGLVYSQLALAELGRGARNDAVENARFGLERVEVGLREEGLTEQHRNRGEALEALGFALFESGKVSEAESILRSALEVRRANGPNGGPDVGMASCLLALAAGETGKAEEARALIETGWPTIASWGRSHPLVLDRIQALRSKLATAIEVREVDPQSTG